MMTPTSQPQIVRLRFSGEFTDAWLYKDHLYAWSRQGQVQKYSLNQIKREILRDYDPHIATIINHLVLRSDYKRSSEVSPLLAIDSVREEFLRPLASVDESTVVMGTDPLAVIDNLHDGYLIDVDIYGDCLLTGTDKGLYVSSIDSAFNAGTPVVHQRSAEPVLGVTTKYGQATISQGEAGLFTLSLSEYLEGVGAGGAVAPNTPRQIAEYSDQASFATSALLNYGESDIPTLLATKTRAAKPSSGLPYERKVIEDFEKPRKIGQEIRRSLLEGGKNPHLPLGPSEIGSNAPVQVLGNSEADLLVEDAHGLEVVRLTARGQAMTFKQVDFYDRIQKSVSSSQLDALRVHPLHMGFVAEGYDRVTLISREGICDVATSPIWRVRTFPNSRHFGETILLITDNHLDLVGFHW